MLVGGTILMALAVILVHFAGFPEEEFVDGVFVPVVIEPAIFDAIPRGWFPKSIGYLLAFGASQLMIVGAAFLWVLNQKMTWARASFAAFLVWIEFVVIYGIVPSEWLNLSQTDLDWSPTRIFVTIPEWLILGNEIQISYAALKDMISGGYNLAVLAGGGWLAWKIQDIGKGRPATAVEEEPVSPYGRPLVRKEDA